MATFAETLRPNPNGYWRLLPKLRAPQKSIHFGLVAESPLRLSRPRLSCGC